MHRLLAHSLITLALAGTAVTATAQTSHKTTRTHKTTKTSANTTSAHWATPTWKNVYTDQTVTVALDPANTIKQPDGTYRTHLKWTYAADQKIDYRTPYRSMIETQLLNCDSIASKPINARAFNAAGKQVSAYDTPASTLPYMSWAHRKKGTGNANAYEAVCKALRA